MQDKPKSKYAKKKEWRQKYCGGTPLPFFPEVMLVPSHAKPWA